MWYSTWCTTLESILCCTSEPVLLICCPWPNRVSMRVPLGSSPQWRWAGWIIQLYLFIISAIYSTTESIQYYKSFQFASSDISDFISVVAHPVRSGRFIRITLQCSSAREDLLSAPSCCRCTPQLDTKPQFSIVLEQSLRAIKPCRRWCFGKWNCSWMRLRLVRRLAEPVVTFRLNWFINRRILALFQIN